MGDGMAWRGNAQTLNSGREFMGVPVTEILNVIRLQQKSRVSFIVDTQLNINIVETGYRKTVTYVDEYFVDQTMVNR